MTSENAICWFCNGKSGEPFIASGRPLARLEGRETPFVCGTCAGGFQATDTNMHHCDFCASSKPTMQSPLQDVRICETCCGLVEQLSEGTFPLPI